ncbi:hypothetical protein RCH33_1237 [Flavobacterium daejeonense]|nr:hypothetical protein RCH33_1237 [Flavobacterium daejeonense]
MVKLLYFPIFSIFFFFLSCKGTTLRDDFDRKVRKSFSQRTLSSKKR